MRTLSSLLALLLLLLLGLFALSSSAWKEPTHLLTNDGSSYDRIHDRTCYSYTFTCNAAKCSPITGFDLDCNCPITSPTPGLDADHGLITWENSTSLNDGRASIRRGELSSFEICTKGRVTSQRHSKFVIKTIVIIIIGEIIVPDCHPTPTHCPTETPTLCPTEPPTVCPTEPPTVCPTEPPTVCPTEPPTVCPTETPTVCPTESPTVCPTESPTVCPTDEPTQPQGGSCLLVVEPPLIAIESAAQFVVSLADAPDGPVSVTISSSCVLLSSCLITLTPANFNVPQVIEVYRNPAYQVGTGCTIELDASGAEDCNASIPVIILPQESSTAQSWADPHILTFDGTYYRAFSTGDYYFVRQFNGNLIIQTRQTSCGPASCNTAVALRFGTLEFYLLLGPTGTVTTQIVGDAAANGITITNTDPYKVYFPGGGFLSIKPFTEGTNNFLNLEVSLPNSYQGQVGGLAGEFTGNPADDFTLLVSGILTTNQNQFIASTLVPSGENLFSNSGATIPLIRGATPQPPIQIGETCTAFSPANDVTAFLQVHEALRSPLAGSPLIQVATSAANCSFPSEAVHQRAIDRCSSFFTPGIISCCKPFGVSEETYYQSCLCDYAILQAADFVFSHLLAFVSTCEAAANANSKSCAAEASLIEAPPNESQTACSSSPCLNGGTCKEGASGFECDCSGTGFTGPRCEKRIICRALPTPEDHASWPQAFAKDISWGKCGAGYLGKPYRLCLETGTFGPITDPCISAETECLGDTYHYAVWPNTKIKTLAQGVCVPGYYGSPTRLCQLNAAWSTALHTHCKRYTCVDDGAGNAAWKTTQSLTSASGKCLVGYGTVKRPCLADGTWGAIEGKCAELSSIPCAPETYNHATWLSTIPGKTANGTCIQGWKGTPNRLCGLDGKWQSLVRSNCQRI